MVVLAFFGMVWLLVALEGRRRKTGLVVAVGGGFIVACLSLFPVIYIGKYLDRVKDQPVVQQISEVQGKSAKGMGIGSFQLLTALGPYAPDLQPAPAMPDGRARMLGQTQGGSTAIMEVAGKALDQSIEKATLSIVATQDAQENSANGQLLSRYLDVLFPDWNERADWATKALKSASKASVELPGKRITFVPTMVAERPILIFTAEAR